MQSTSYHQSNSLYLRRPQPGDAQILYEKMYCNKSFMCHFRPSDVLSSETELRQRLETQSRLTPEQQHSLELLIVHKEQGPIGLAVLAEYAPLHRRAEFMIGLFNPEPGQSRYTVEAALMLMDLAFNSYGLHKLYSYVFTDNTLSQTSTLSLGFSQEGVLQEHIYSLREKCFYDAYQNGLTMSVFRKNKRLARLSRRLLNKDITLSPEKTAQPQSTVTQAARKKATASNQGILK
ncbi:GNAT family N-acetyltransferase, partial [Candidatus Venteria ishoeyi]|uniref:GNAT family N-acetyltransferase n=1 Tax=Candidatus Venteria ishoeyi TaxID=1899563 RepID=UPI0015A9B4C2